jgi:hypothetical protein
MNKTFEECIGDIDQEIRKQNGKWNLKFLAHLNYEDVAQIIRIHIHKKWHLWDQSRPIGPWCARIIQHQIKNLQRNNYANFAKPCVKCPFSQGDGFEENQGLCAITTDGTQCSECPLFARWEKSKKDAFGVKMPISIEASIHNPEVTENIICSNDFDFERAFNSLNEKIKEKLNNPKLYKAYEMLFVQKSTDEDVAKFMGYKSSEANRNAGYKQIRNLKKRFKELAKKILNNQDVIF